MNVAVIFGESYTLHYGLSVDEVQQMRDSDRYTAVIEF